MTTKKILIAAAMTLFATWLGAPVDASIPQLITYQGLLKNSSGSYLTGTYEMVFKIYDVSTGGTALWTETQSSVSVSSGRFSVELGSVTTLNIAFDETYWLGIQVGSDSEMTPRVKITSAGYAIKAGEALNGFTSGDHNGLSHYGIEGVKAAHTVNAKTNFKLDAHALASANNMGDMIVDAFNDSTGIDSGLSSTYLRRGSPYYDVKVGGGDIDAYTVLLLHGNDTDGSTTFTDSSDGAHSVAANGSAQIDTAQSKFGGASGLFNRTTSDYLTLTDHADYDIGTGDFTIDFWYRLNSNSEALTIIGPSSGQAFPTIYLAGSSGANKTRTVIIGGSSSTFGSAYSPTLNQWIHVAVVRCGSNLYWFENGTQVGSTATNSGDGSSANNIFIGFNNSLGQYWDGWIDELRISKGVARWTSNFTPSSSEYAAATSGTVVSVDFSTTAAPSEAMIIADETLNSGSITYYVSRNNGTNWTECTKETVTSISAQPSGTQVRWKAAIAGDAELNGIAITT